VTPRTHHPRNLTGSDVVTYTVWSHGELLGESELDYVRVFPHLRTGDLHVTPKGLIAFDRLAQTRADSYYAARRLNNENSRGTIDPSDQKTLFADLAAEHDQHEALELHAPNGSVIATESIFVTDTEYLLAIDSERAEEDALESLVDPDDLAALEQDLEEFEEDHPPWAQPATAREPVRFQVSVTLKEEWEIP
jgi:hypothetical protein